MEELLFSIDKSLKRIVALLEKAAPKPVASDAELVGQYGDPEVKVSVRKWTGPSMKGKRFSQCPAAFLDVLAEFFDWAAEKAEDTNETWNNKPVAPYRRADAAKARGWAIRNRQQPPAASDDFTPATDAPSGSGWAEPPSDDDIPFLWWFVAVAGPTAMFALRAYAV